MTFVLVSGAWGYFDHHGDNVRWGGIEKGLTPLLPDGRSRAVRAWSTTSKPAACSIRRSC